MHVFPFTQIIQPHSYLISFCFIFDFYGVNRYRNQMSIAYDIIVDVCGWKWFGINTDYLRISSVPRNKIFKHMGKKFMATKER